MDVTEHHYPNAIEGRIRQIGAIALIIIMLLAALALVILAGVIGAPLFAIMALLILLLIAPVLLLLVNTPPVQIAPDGLRLLTLTGEKFIAWEAVVSVRRYPLLPAPEQESMRRLLVGRQKYVPAKGIMLLIPELPLLYRIAGVLAGAQGVPIVTFTNRTHTDYDVLVQRVHRFARNAAIHDQE
jgi:hypothetical protein